MPALVHLLIWILIIGAILSVFWWVITLIPLPPPFAMVARVILAIIALLLLLNLLLPLAGGPGCTRLLC